MSEVAYIEVTYRREPHAGHYGRRHPAVGHDLEWWTFAAAHYEPRPAEIPADAEYHSGSRTDGVQRWHYTRTAPLSPGTCPRCPRPRS